MNSQELFDRVYAASSIIAAQKALSPSEFGELLEQREALHRQFVDLVGFDIPLDNVVVTHDKRCYIPFSDYQVTRRKGFGDVYMLWITHIPTDTTLSLYEFPDIANFIDQTINTVILEIK